MTNRAARRRAARPAGIPLMPGTDSQAPQAMTAALFAALTSDCTCKTCRLLRKAASTIGDDLLEEEDGAPDDQSP